MPRAVLCSCIGNLLLPLSTFAIQNVSIVQDFEAAFRRANASKDFRTARVLGYWEHANPKSSREMREVLQKEFGRPIDRIQVRPFSLEAAIYPPRKPNLKPMYLFTVWSVDGRDKLGQRIVGTFYTLGRKAGQYYLLVSDQWPVSSVHYR
jgi:hypothetical protein